MISAMLFASEGAQLGPVVALSASDVGAPQALSAGEGQRSFGCSSSSRWQGQRLRRQGTSLHLTPVPAHIAALVMLGAGPSI